MQVSFQKYSENKTYQRNFWPITYEAAISLIICTQVVSQNDKTIFLGFYLQSSVTINGSVMHLLRQCWSVGWKEELVPYHVSFDGRDFFFKSIFCSDSRPSSWIMWVYMAASPEVIQTDRCYFWSPLVNIITYARKIFFLFSEMRT